MNGVVLGVDSACWRFARREEGAARGGLRHATRLQWKWRLFFDE